MILSLFASVYEGRDPRFSDEQWAELLEQAIRFDLAPQLYHLIRQKTEISIPSFVLDGLKPSAFMMIAHNT